MKTGTFMLTCGTIALLSLQATAETTIIRERVVEVPVVESTTTTTTTGGPIAVESTTTTSSSKTFTETTVAPDALGTHDPCDPFRGFRR